VLYVKQVIEIDRFVELKSYVGKRDNFILNSTFNFEPMERFENWSDVRKLWSFGHSNLFLLLKIKAIYSKLYAPD